MPESAAGIFAAFSPEEVQTLADLKRLHERAMGDPRFRILCREPAGGLDAALREMGISKEMATVCSLLAGGTDLKSTAPIPTHPALDLWRRWRRESAQQVATRASAFPIAHAGVATWRRRFVNRLRSELGPFRDYHATSPLIAFELSLGCSVGCWFCGVAAGRFSGYVPYGVNQGLWRSILDINQSILGAGSHDAVLYYATEPFDNPDYLHFLDDFHAVTGFLPQTTTAIPFKHPALWEAILQRREATPTMCDRVSILSASGLERLHRSYSPYALRHVELAMMNRDALVPKSPAGHAIRSPKRLAAGNRVVFETHRESGTLVPQSIGCVVGFRVNLVARTLDLTAPCNTSTEHPDGMRRLAQRSFRDATEYREALTDLIEQYMTPASECKRPLRFRPDLRYEPIESGFMLTSGYLRHRFQGKPWYVRLGERVASADLTERDIAIELSALGVPLPEVTFALEQLLEQGILEREWPSSTV